MSLFYRIIIIKHDSYQKQRKKNFVPVLNCDNNVVLYLHKTISHCAKRQRYPPLALANFQYRFTHSRRQLRLPITATFTLIMTLTTRTT